LHNNTNINIIRTLTILFYHIKQKRYTPTIFHETRDIDRKKQFAKIVKRNAPPAKTLAPPTKTLANPVTTHTQKFQIGFLFR